jgi:hypothetical protein
MHSVSMDVAEFCYTGLKLSRILLFYSALTATLQCTNCYQQCNWFNSCTGITLREQCGGSASHCLHWILWYRASVSNWQINVMWCTIIWWHQFALLSNTMHHFFDVMHWYQNNVHHSNNLMSIYGHLLHCFTVAATLRCTNGYITLH